MSLYMIQENDGLACCQNFFSRKARLRAAIFVIIDFVMISYVPFHLEVQ